MPRIEINDLPVDETLDAHALKSVRGGIIAIRIGYKSIEGIKGESIPTETLSLNFDKVTW